MYIKYLSDGNKFYKFIVTDIMTDKQMNYITII